MGLAGTLATLLATLPNTEAVDCNELLDKACFEEPHATMFYLEVKQGRQRLVGGKLSCQTVPSTCWGGQGLSSRQVVTQAFEQTSDFEGPYPGGIVCFGCVRRFFSSSFLA